jgi:Uma2 family endonuclease
MATTLPTAVMTIDEFCAWANRPENADRMFELDRGRVVEVPPPKQGHGLFNWLVIRLLTDYVTRRGSGYLLTNDTGIIVGRNPDTLRGADVILFLRQLRAEDVRPTYVEDVPDLIVEVLSPTDRPNQVTRRVGQYLHRGIPLVWVIDPEDRTLTVYRPNELPRVLDESDELTGNGVLPDFRCRVADLFALPGQPPATPQP